MLVPLINRCAHQQAVIQLLLRTGVLPLELIRMKAKGCSVVLRDNKSFTLPSNIGKLGDDIVELDLSQCSLRGSGIITVVLAARRLWGPSGDLRHRYRCIWARVSAALPR